MATSTALRVGAVLLGVLTAALTAPVTLADPADQENPAQAESSSQGYKHVQDFRMPRMKFDCNNAGTGCRWIDGSGALYWNESYSQAKISMNVYASCANGNVEVYSGGFYKDGTRWPIRDKDRKYVRNCDAMTTMAEQHIEFERSAWDSKSLTLQFAFNPNFFADKRTWGELYEIPLPSTN